MLLVLQSGQQYQKTRHNVGAWLLEQLAQQLNSPLKIETKFQGEIAKAQIASRACWLLKPTTYMNHNGQSIAAIARFYKIPAEAILVIHDELDFPAGTIRIKRGGGHGGHNGLKSIHQAIGDQYVRLRIGIGRPNEKNQISSYVLSNFNVSENDLMETHKKTFQIGIGELLNHNFGNFMELINTKISEDLKLPRKQSNKPFVGTVSSKPPENEPANKNTVNFLKNLLKKFN